MAHGTLLISEKFEEPSPVAVSRKRGLQFYHNTIDPAPGGRWRYGTMSDTFPTVNALIANYMAMGSSHPLQLVGYVPKG